MLAGFDFLFYLLSSTRVGTDLELFIAYWSALGVRSRGAAVVQCEVPGSRTTLLEGCLVIFWVFTNTLLDDGMRWKSA